METMQELTRRLHRLQAAEQCRNVAGKLAFYLTAFRAEDAASLWADRDDCTWNGRVGCFASKDGIRAGLLADMGERSDPKQREKLRGRMDFYENDTFIIDVDESCTHAYGAWMALGLKTSVDADKTARGRWVWGKYTAEFIPQDGQWKLLHLRFAADIDADYHGTWTPSEQTLENLWF